MSGTWKLFGLWLASGTIAACGGGSVSGSKASNTPLVLNLQASPQTSWTNGPVTFTVTCIGAKGADSKLTYKWTFGDGTSDTTTAPSDVHDYVVAPTTPAQYAAFSASVECIDSSYSPMATQTAPALNVNILTQDLSVVAADVCSSGAQGIGWCWQNPLPTGVNLHAVAAISPLVGWTVGDAGTVLETNDGGIHWLPRFLGLSAPGGAPPDLLTIQAADQNIALVVGSNGVLFSTTDGGATWTKSPTTSATAPLALSSAFITDATHLWGINGGSSIVHSADGGVDWSTAMVSNLASGAQLSSIAAANGTSAFAVGNESSLGAPIVLQTSDGSNWSSQDLDISGLGSVSSAEYLLASSVSITAGSKCANASATAESIWIGGYSEFFPHSTSDIGIVSPLSFYTLGSTIAWTAGLDGGRVVAAFDQNTAWASAADAETTPMSVIAGTTPTGGASFSQAVSFTSGGPNAWRSSTPFTSPVLNALDSRDCVHGWATGDAGAIWYTTDSAQSWNPQTNAVTGSVGSVSFGSVSAATAHQAFALEDQVTYDSHGGYTSKFQVFTTNDGGLNWILLPNGTAVTSGGGSVQQTIGQVASNRSGDAVAAIAAGLVTSVSPGSVPVDWYAVGGFPNGSPGWISAAISDTTAWIADGTGVVANQTLDNSSSSPITSWQPVSLPAALVGSTTINGIAAVGPSTALVIGSSGFIARTIDAGQNWNLAAAPSTPNTLRAISITNTCDNSDFSKCVGWAVGDAGTMLATANSGASWAAVPNGHVSFTNSSLSLADISFISVAAADDSNAWAIGQSCDSNGFCSEVLIRTTNGGVTWTQQQTGARYIASVAAVDVNTAWIVGPHGAILKTVTGGQAPSKIPSP